MRASKPATSRLRVWAGAALLAVLVTGCTTLHEYIENGFKVGPNYSRPPAAVADKWIDSGDPRIRTEPEEHRHWWTVFDDPILNELICVTYLQNLSLKQQSFHILELQAILGTVIGRLFPQEQFAYGSFIRNQLSTEVANRQFIAERNYNTITLGLGLTWELDFWGKYRRNIEARQAELDAGIEDYDNLLVEALADVATAYAQYRILEREIELVRANVKLQEETLKIATARFKGGLVSELDVDQAESILQQTKAQIPQLEIQQRQAQNQICFLLGIPPIDLSCKLGKGPIPKTPPDVILGVPCDLLRRRPDVRKAEREAAARSAEIGISDAEFYPAVSIVGANGGPATIGYQAESFSNLFSGNSLFGSIGPSFNWPILNYGRIANNVLRAEARFQAAVVNYQQAVLKANKEVEDAVIQFLLAQKRAKELAGSVKAAEKSVQIALAQYGAGRIDFNRVSTIEQNLVQQQDLEAQAQGQIALGLIAVFKALGGGWQIRLDGCTPTGPLATAHPATTETKPDKPDTLPAPRPVEKTTPSDNGEDKGKNDDKGQGTTGATRKTMMLID